MMFSVNFDSEKLERTFTDYVIVGSGIAGLNAAYHAANYGKVILLTKGKLTDSNSMLAQGGIACVTSMEDSFELHINDTVFAGCGLCDIESVNVLVREAPQNIKRLTDIGIKFDDESGVLKLGREGAHSKNRIIHAGDYTGKQIVEGYLNIKDRFEIRENTLALDLLTENNRCIGVLAKNLLNHEMYIIWSKVVILATGGAGNIFLNTTNPASADGSGIAMAARQGAALKDMEFMQFHPTALYEKSGERFLISEAVRGEGGILRNEKGQRFMQKYHHLGELAPRDVVSRAICTEIKKGSIPYVYLDVTSIGAEKFLRRFPSIYKKLFDIGINISKDCIPVSPVAHYYMGGIMTDLNGETSIKGLYAIGECACTGVHGANRLASNSLLEGLVFSSRAVENSKKYLLDDYKVQKFVENSKAEKIINIDSTIKELKKLMEENVGIYRDEKSLKTMLNWIMLHGNILNFDSKTELSNKLLSLYTVGMFMTKAAMLRRESRGSHYRSDYPESSKFYERHILVKGGNFYFDRQICSTESNR